MIRRLTGQQKVIVIDEVQWLLVLLNEVHAMIRVEPGRALRIFGAGA